MEKILSKQEVLICRDEANFNKACEMAINQAVKVFGIDEDGHSKLKGWQRNCCSVEVEFVKYRGSVNHHYYTFKAFAIKNTD